MAFYIDMNEMRMKIVDGYFEPKLSSLFVVGRSDAVGSDYVGIVQNIHKRILYNTIDTLISMRRKFKSTLDQIEKQS